MISYAAHMLSSSESKNVFIAVVVKNKLHIIAVLKSHAIRYITFMSVSNMI